LKLAENQRPGGKCTVGKIMAVNISEKRGTQKVNVHTARVLEDFGIEHDAHAGKWHRQVSLLSYEKIEEFKEKGAPVDDGAFGENLIVQGIDLKDLPVGTLLQCNEVILEVTQIGKQCHSGCDIYKVMGDCIMPREGIFARVLHGGVITEGDEIDIKSVS
jgi:TatD DNase family protein